MEKHAIIVAGGIGKRMNSDIPKQFIILAGKPVLMHTISAFFICDPEIKITLVLPSEHICFWKKLCKEYNFSIKHKIVPGGEERFFSVKNGLDSVSNECLIAIHDGVRALISTELINRIFDYSGKYGNAIPVIPVNESVREILPGNLSKHIDRSLLKIVQTPQCFHSSVIKKAYEQEFNIDQFTDDASVVEATGIKINLIEGEKTNIKITTPDDLLIAEALLETALNYKRE
ncbi:MAG: 2-C-methyl-D-erythritol 4-phosphate cytidylyltransferase [Bacteroidota bacterium]|nr:2-C-methyl-D-erythritol 4-phosphate cytidylyltransferase [Bacteroidota bacterium]